MKKNKYLFDRMDTGLYKEGHKPCDYIPIHGMVLLDYQDKDTILQLILYTPDKDEEFSKFAWARYTWSNEANNYVLENATLAKFDLTKSFENQELPPKIKMGNIIYRKVVGIS